jgi:hypothetical protein
MMPLHDGRGWYPPQTASNIHIRHIKCVWGIGLRSQGHMDAPMCHYTSKADPRFWNWVICGVKMMPLHHGWGWHPPQTASHIHIRHIKCVWGIVLLSQASEVETKVILMGHPGLSCHVPVVRSIFILLIPKYRLEIFVRFTLLRMYYNLTNFLIITL